MLKFLFAAVLFIFLAAGINAQSKDCCSKDKADVTTVNKHCDTPETVSKDSENSEQLAGALTNENVKKETKKDVAEKKHTDMSKDEKGCCSTDKKKTDEPNK